MSKNNEETNHKHEFHFVEIIPIQYLHTTRTWTKQKYKFICLCGECKYVKQKEPKHIHIYKTIFMIPTLSRKIECECGKQLDLKGYLADGKYTDEYINKFLLEEGTIAHD